LDSPWCLHGFAFVHTPPFKHLNYMHMASHTLGQFQHSDSFCNPKLTSTFGSVGLNLLWTFQVVQSIVAWDYHLSSDGLTTKLCLVHGLNTLGTSPQAPLLEPSLVDTYAIQKCCQTKSRTQPNTSTRNPSHHKSCPTVIWTWAPSKQLLTWGST